MDLIAHGEAWVCTDCYFAHHYGAHEIKPEEADERNQAGWYAGESDTPCELEPLGELDGFTVFDNVCSNHYYGQDAQRDEDGEPDQSCEQCSQRSWENGITEFSMSSCDGCGSHLGGKRYRLSLWKEAA